LENHFRRHGQLKKTELNFAIGSCCWSCSFGLYPLDDALGLSNRKAQPDIQELEAWLSAAM
jgi:hypothetical protein